MPRSTPLYDTEETADILLKMTEIISGNTDKFLEWVEKLTGLKAEPVKAAYAETRKTHEKGSFAAACRGVSFAQTAERLGTTPEHIDQVLREKGVYHEEDKQRHPRAPCHAAQDAGADRQRAGGVLQRPDAIAARQRPHGAQLQRAGDLDRPRIPGGQGRTTEPLAEDEFYFTYGKTPTVSHGSTNSNNPVLAAINQFKDDIYKGVWIHPDRAGSWASAKATGSDADQHQIRPGDAPAAPTSRDWCSADTLFIYSSFGVENKALSRTQGDGTATNKLIPYQVEPVVAGFTFPGIHHQGGPRLR